MKLLRVLQTGEFQRLGSSTTRRADVRLISATNADLKAEIAAGRFREDLYFRLNVIDLAVPPLSHRPEDVELLARHFLKHHAPERSLAFAPEALAILIEHDWPGNVRELDNRVQRAVLVCGEGPISVAHLGLGERTSGAHGAAPELRPSAAPSAGAPSSVGTAAPAGAAARAKNPLEDAERAVVESALARASGVVSRAAAELGLSRQALYRRMDRLGIAIERRVR
jgi:DNA-binding NtrC family response regulator